MNAIIQLQSKTSWLLTSEIRMKSIVLEKTLRSKQDLIRYVSHEVRTPLSNISSILGFVIDDLLSGNLSSLNENIRNCRSECMAAISILSDILSTEKIESGQFIKIKLRSN